MVTVDVGQEEEAFAVVLESELAVEMVGQVDTHAQALEEVLDRGLLESMLQWW